MSHRVIYCILQLCYVVVCHSPVITKPFTVGPSTENKFVTIFKFIQLKFVSIEKRCCVDNRT